MVPFIDVMLVLLIIFMVTAPLIAPSMIDLPSVAKASRAPDQVIQVIIGKDEALEVKIDKNTSRLPLDALVAAVTQAQAGRPAGASAVVISADRNVKYESVVNVMDKLQQAGVKRVGLVGAIDPVTGAFGLYSPRHERRHRPPRIRPAAAAGPLARVRSRDPGAPAAADGADLGHQLEPRIGERRGRSRALGQRAPAGGAAGGTAPVRPRRRTAEQP